MIQWTEDYNAETIINQVFEAPYSWFINYSRPNDSTWKILVQDEDSGPITSHMIFDYEVDEAVLKAYTTFMNLPKDHRNFRTFVDWIEDLDANDVDLILQWACFKEVRYG